MGSSPSGRNSLMNSVREMWLSVTGGLSGTAVAEK